MVIKIAVLGAGINGITCAVQIKEKYKNFEVTLISYEISPNTTGDGSGGLWYPYLCGDTPETKLNAGHTFTTFVVQPPKIISYLYQRFKNSNGKVLRNEVTSLQDPLLSRFDVVINCTGLGSRAIVPDDKVFPIRGQIIKTLAPWMNVTVIDENSGHYIIPNAQTCVLGGTHQEHDFNTNVDEKDSEFILNGCTKIIPGLKQGKIVNTWVGLRPGREEVRIEAEERNGRLYIHNYGHGGSGLTLFWGCGAEVLNILERSFDKINKQVEWSKL